MEISYYAYRLVTKYANSVSVALYWSRPVCRHVHCPITIFLKIDIEYHWTYIYSYAKFQTKILKTLPCRGPDINYLRRRLNHSITRLVREIQLSADAASAPWLNHSISRLVVDIQLPSKVQLQTFWPYLQRIRVQYNQEYSNSSMLAADNNQQGSGESEPANIYINGLWLDFYFSVWSHQSFRFCSRRGSSIIQVLYCGMPWRWQNIISEHYGAIALCGSWSIYTYCHMILLYSSQTSFVNLNNNKFYF